MRKLFPFLLFILWPSVSNALQFSGETGFYTVKLKGNYKRQLGFEDWRGSKGGYYYGLELRQKFKVSKKADFFLSVLSGSPKVPYLNLFTSEGDKLFPGSWRRFNVKEIYLFRRGFIWKNLNLKVGKQEFRVPGIFRDYLWGGSFEYHFSEGFSVYWNQIAGYEGRYLLFSKEEDDVDIAVFGINWKRLNFGLYRIMDAKGELPAVSKNGFFGEYRGKAFRLTLFSQNGKAGGVSGLTLGNLSLNIGYSEKGITSYGYSEDVRDLGLIFKPSFSGVRFASLSYSPFSFLSLYLLRVESSAGSLIGNEFGGEVWYPFLKGEVFLRGALGSHNSYALFGGYRWGIRIPKEIPSFNYNVENFFRVWGEYSDLPMKSYKPQIGYEGWERARHIGYWHTTYKLSVSSENLRLKVSTGRNTKVDYIVWGNTADNFLYQKNHGKLWHLEELNYIRGKFKFGLQPFSVWGVFNDFLPGISYSSKFFSLGSYYHEADEGFGVYSVSLKHLNYTLISNKNRSNSILTGFLKGKNFLVSLSKEWGSGQGREWGALIKLNYEFLGNLLGLSYRVHSKKFSTFGIREFQRNDGLIIRPGEGDERYLRAYIERPISFKFNPRVRFIYDRLHNFSGKFLAQEFGISLSFNPCKRGEFSLLGALGTNHSYYEGVKFSVSW